VANQKDYFDVLLFPSTHAPGGLHLSIGDFVLVQAANQFSFRKMRVRRLFEEEEKMNK